jgi:hypothetical protein
MTAATSGSWPTPGPLETARFPDQLRARVVTPGEQPRIHGYDVESDLAPNYSPSEVAFLATTGELPAREVAAALDCILVFAAPVSVAHAPTHAAVLARLCGCEPSSVLSVAAIALAEQTKHTLAQHEPFLSWLETCSGDVPDAFRAIDQHEVEASLRLGAALRSVGFEVSVLDRGLTREAAVLAGLYACGIRSNRQCEVLLVWTRLPTVVAEALSEHATNFRHYPINLPQYVYEE